jgi:hypothetical protein
MAQEPMQETGQHRWRPGESGNPGGARTRRLKLQRLIAEFSAPYGGVTALAPDEIELLRQAALLATRRVNDVEQQVRVANALRSIFEMLAGRHRGTRPLSLSVADSVKPDNLVAAALQQLRPDEGDR